ncbi:MAG: leucyl aminopeptidase [Synechococcaceae bacterium WB5_2B_268]|nr:leucyl aminopeptidase [Synechococcaceae bacterium WB5_2B_268]
MEFRCSNQPLADGACDALGLGLFSNHWQEQLKSLAPNVASTATALLQQREFKAKPAELISLTLPGEQPGLLLVAGLGEPENFDGFALRTAAAQLSKASLGSGCKQLGLALPLEGLAPSEAIAALVQGSRLALFKDERFRSAPEPRQEPDICWLLGVNPEQQGELEHQQAICAGVELARELVGGPPNLVNALSLEATARSLAEEFDLELTVLDEQGCREKGMGAFLAVAQGASVPPRFIHLVIPAKGPALRRVALIGKGLSFDSGGYNLKTGGSQIELMKFDMGGCGAVLGAARSLASLRPEGTIEINNTDAEGRLTLADALVYASALKPDAIVDLATLTGACVVALGDEIAGLWSASDQLANQLIEAGRAAGEPLWRMPLQNSYKDGLKSGLADMKNTGPRPGGAITAALFLQEFVDGQIPWAHLDIAGPVWNEKGKGPDPSGATGFGVRLLVNWCKTIAAGAKEELSLE